MQGDPRRAPWWVSPLLLAEKWGIYPGDLVERKGSLTWAARQNALDEARVWHAKLKSKD